MRAGVDLDQDVGIAIGSRVLSRSGTEQGHMRNTTVPELALVGL
jgi:hypothetical protein